jgi:Neurotransmitter-gated ion-channel ligand binding domain
VPHYYDANFEQDYDGSVLVADNVGDLAPLTVSFTLLDIPSVDDIGGTVQLKLATNLQWADHRLSYANLVDNFELNGLSQAEFDSIWSPSVFFPNKEPNFHELEEIISPAITIIANSSRIAPLSELNTGMIFDGRYNTLMWRSQIM